MNKNMPKKRRKLTGLENRFVQEYVADPDLNASRAAVNAGYGVKSSRAAASRLLTKENVAAAIESAQSKRMERMKIKQDDVLRFWAEMIHANPNDLTEYRITCCRYCHGKDGRYQRTNREFEDAYNAWQAVQSNPSKAEKRGPFEPQGGSGYDPRKKPNQDCMDCFGDGIGKVIIKDTRNLSPAARRLYAGVKITATGAIEVKMHDSAAAIDKTAQHLGMLVNRHKIDLTDLKNKSTEELQALLDSQGR